MIYTACQKGQRTKDDREIYIAILAAKMILYPIEYSFQYLCKACPSEKISLPGDEKVIDMHNQQRQMNRWLHNCAMSKDKKIKELFGEGSFDEMRSYQENRISVSHYNLDFTKWSPGDNVLKFIDQSRSCLS